MRAIVIVSCFIGLTMWLGCETSKTPATSGKPVAQPTDDHEHHHEHGPHGGVAFSLPNAEFKVEGVTTKNNDLVQIFFLDHEAKAPNPIKADKVIVRTDKLGGKSFELKPVNPDANGLAAEFSLADKTLRTITSLEPTMEVTIDGKTYSGPMEFHE